MMKKIALGAAVGLFVVCAAFVFSPVVKTATGTVQQKEAVARFLQTVDERQEAENPTVGAKKAPVDPLLQAMQQYNRDLQADGQDELQGAWYEEPALDLSAYDVPDGIIGRVSIPAVGVELPLYLGANSAHLAKGLAVMNHTSLPIGGEGTHCVIAGHRGWDTGDFLLDIDELQIGDEVIVQNLWQTLHYAVAEIQIIEPSEIEPAKLQAGRDLLTLLTCHPYGSGGKYRYLVTCVREEETEAEQPTEPTEKTKPTEAVKSTEAARPTEATLGVAETEAPKSQKRTVAWIGGGIVVTLLILLNIIKRRNRT